MKTTVDDHWDLSDLHTTLSIEETSPLLAQIESRVRGFSEVYKGKVRELSATALNDALVEYDSVRAQMYKVSQFSHLHYAVDQKDDKILAFVSKIDEFTSTMGNEMLFFFLEVGSVSEQVLKDWLSNPKNEPYKYTLNQAVKKNKYRLTEQEERLINLKDLNGCDALRKLYSEHTSQYVFKMTIDGKEKEMNGSECRALRYHADPAVRQSAMKQFLHRYKGDQHIMVHLFNSIIKDYNIERQSRGYDKPMDIMNIHNDLPNDLVQLLHQITSDSNHLVQSYYRIKKELLGLETMTLADIYAP